jgi:DNA mismatch repair protein MutL
MFEIKVLDKVVQNQIAAGEVIERPSSVLKELVENALDANSKSILVELSNGGKSLIYVQDNGKGIHPDDIELSVVRYATSKIYSSLDLEKISSYGFRGEALASIASVSRLTIPSCYGSLPTNKVVFENSELISKTEESATIGTGVKVEGLFFNTPARKKF